MVGRDERRNAYNQLVRVGTGACSVWFEHAVRICRSRLCVAREVFRRCSRGAVMPGTNQRHTLQADLRGLSALLRRATLLRRFRSGACHALGCRQRLHDGGTSMAVLPRRSRRWRLSCFAELGEREEVELVQQRRTRQGWHGACALHDSNQQRAGAAARARCDLREPNARQAATVR